ncbi:MAG: CotH kinase family protein [Akkermansiaceae bacterium]|nr:CotH kinase family protein [Akkermansiaceae bacterium]
MKSAGMSGGGSEGAILFRRRSNSGTVLALTDSSNAHPGRIFCQPTNGGAAFYSTARVDDNQWHHVAFVYDQAAGRTDRIYIDGAESGSATHSSAWSWPPSDSLLFGRSNTTYWYKYNGLLDEVRVCISALTPAQLAQIHQGAGEAVEPADVGPDLSATLPGNPGVFLRLPFTVTHPADVQSLRFAARCGGGFVAFLNGNQVAAANVVPPPVWDGTATATALPTRSQVFQISSSNLAAGPNMLALHALKRTAADPGFLSLITLDATSHDATGHYLQAPTPAAANSAALENLGPIVTTVRYNGTLELPPRPPGGTAPSFFNPTASDQYFGTVAQDRITTALPVYHVFVPGTYQFNNSHVIDQNNVGGRGSFFFDGELYDNVFLRIKGDTTRTMNKRSHRVDFNPVHQFRYAPGRKLLRELALNAEYVDPSYSRQMMSMGLHRATGTGAPDHFPVRCQINGMFWQLAFHTETADAELLENIGLDPNGALYSSVGQMSGAAGEKQTRVTESYADMSAFVIATNAKGLSF